MFVSLGYINTKIIGDISKELKEEKDNSIEDFIEFLKLHNESLKNNPKAEFLI